MRSYQFRTANLSNRSWTLPSDHQPLALCGIGDIDGDSYPDFVAGSLFWTFRASIVAFSGRTSAPIHRWTAHAQPFSVLEGRGIDIDRDSTPCGQRNVRPMIGLRYLSGPPPQPKVRITMAGASPRAPAALLIGASNRSHAGLRLPAALGSIGLPQCFLRTSLEIALPTITGASGNAAGYAAFDIPIQITASGRYPLFAQWVTLAPTGQHVEGMSDALAWRAQ